MSAIDKYVIRTVLTAWLMVLVSLTGIIWITQALREIDLITAQGQTILVFLSVSSLILAPLAMVIAPLALVIAVTFSLNRFSTESEIIVLNASGLSPTRFLRPFMVATFAVSVFVLFLAFYLSPQSLRSLKKWEQEIGADVLTNVLRPGDFKKLGSLTIRVRERLPGGVLTGIFIDDQRNPAERINIIAEQGVVQKNERGSILVLQTGNFQRIELGKRDPSIVEFKSYAFDLSQFSRPPEKITLGARERFFEELISPSSEDSFEKQSPGVLRIELHDRLLSVFYPFAFVILAFAVLAPPRTTREGRSFAICVLVLAVLVIRMGGFGLSAVSAANPSAVFIQYLLLAAATSVGLLMIVRGVTIDTPTAIAGVLSRFRS